MGKNFLTSTIIIIMFFSAFVTMSADDSKFAVFVKANTQLKEKDTLSAIKTFEGALKKFPKETNIYNRLITIYQTKGSHYNIQRATELSETLVAIKMGTFVPPVEEPVSDAQTVAGAVATTASTTVAVANAAPAQGIVTADPQNLVQDVTANQPVAAPSEPQHNTTSTGNELDDLLNGLNDMADAAPEAPQPEPEKITEVIPVKEEQKTEEIKVTENASSDDIMAWLKEVAEPKPQKANPAPAKQQQLQYKVNNNVALSYCAPYHFTDNDFNTLDDEEQMGKKYVSTLFNRDNGRDMIAISPANGTVTFDTKSDIENAYKNILEKSGKRYSVQENHIYPTSVTANSCNFSVEYTLYDDVLARVKCDEVCNRMIGKYIRQISELSPVVMLELDEYEKNDTLHHGYMKLKYDFTLTLRKGLLVGKKITSAKRTIKVPVDSINTTDRNFILVADTSDVIFFNAPENYVVKEINTDSIKTVKDKIAFSKLGEEYFSFLKERKLMSEDDYDATDIYNQISGLALMNYPEALYTLYTGVRCGMWYLRKSEAACLRYKERMFSIRDQLRTN